MTLQTAHEELLRREIHGPPSEEDALLWMVLLHTHAVRLRPGTLTNGTARGREIPVLAATTQRGAASAIAEVWPDRGDERANYVHWHWQFNLRTPYEDVSQVPANRLRRPQELRRQLARDPCVVAVTEEV